MNKDGCLSQPRQYEYKLIISIACVKSYNLQYIITPEQNKFPYGIDFNLLFCFN